MNDSWHVAICRFGQALRAAEAIASLDCVAEVYAPLRIWVDVVRGRSTVRRQPWLGTLVLARWPVDDPHAWHDVMSATSGPFGEPCVAGILGGWPPATVPDIAVKRFADAIQVIESKGQVIISPPCGTGDLVRFSYLEIFYNVLGHCLWVSDGIIGVRVPMLGYDQVIQVPYESVTLVRAVGEDYLRRQRVVAPQYRRQQKGSLQPS